MNKENECFQSIRFWIWTLVVLNVLMIVLPANANSTEQIQAIIVEEAKASRVPVALALAVVKTESNFRPDYEGPDGARGLMQILPDTAESLGLDPRALWQIRPNVRAGLSILDGLLQRTDGQWDETLLAYGSRRRDLNSALNHRYLASVLKSERQYAEQFLAIDSLAQRNPVSIAGHDDWGAVDQRQVASADMTTDVDDAPYSTQPSPREADDDGWVEDAASDAVPDIIIYQENADPPVEIVIFERQSEALVHWLPGAPVLQNFTRRQGPRHQAFRTAPRNRGFGDRHFAGNSGGRNGFRRNGRRR